MYADIGLRQSLVNVDAHKQIPDIIYNDTKQNIYSAVELQKCASLCGNMHKSVS